MGHRRIQNVWLSLDLRIAYGRGILKGVARYAGLHRRWRLLGQPRQAVPRPGPHERLDGAIVHAIAHMDLPAAVAHVPFVNVSNADPPEGVPQVCSDDVAIGRLAAEHLIARGFRQFVVFGGRGHRYSQQRQAGFTEVVCRERGRCEVHALEPVGGDPSWEAMQRELVRRLRQLPRPAAVFAVNDAMAWRVTEAAREAGLRVPEDIAVLGVDNDETICDVADPPLSSVQPALERIGYEAACLLDRLMRGGRPPRKPVLVQPLGVVTRRSTDVTAIPDALVARSVGFISEHVAEGLGVSDVVAAAPASRRVLERRFREALGRTILQEIRRSRLDRARHLLASTDLQLKRVAALSGFRNAKQLGAAFRLRLHTTPDRYRKQFRA